MKKIVIMVLFLLLCPCVHCANAGMLARHLKRHLKRCLVRRSGVNYRSVHGENGNPSLKTYLR
jgi:hypothetical protein